MNPWVQWKIGPLNERKHNIGGAQFSFSVIMGGRVFVKIPLLKNPQKANESIMCFCHIAPLSEGSACL